MKDIIDDFWRMMINGESELFKTFNLNSESIKGEPDDKKQDRCDTSGGGCSPNS